MPTANPSPADVVKIVDDGIQASERALDLYNKAIDQLIPWDEFEKTINNLQQRKEDYSEKAAALVGKVQTLLMDSRDRYRKSVQSVFEWCQTASPLLTGYLDLFKDFDKEKASAQKKILIQVLESGKTKMENAQDSLNQSSMSFNDASGQLTTLNSVLSGDFTQGSAYFEAQVTRIRTEAYGGAAAGVIFGPLGLAVSYGIAAGVVEGELVPKLMKQLAEVQATFNALTVLVESAQKNIVEAKEKIANEIRIIGNMKSKTEETELWVEFDDLMLKQLKESAGSLINSCNEYVKRHT